MLGNPRIGAAELVQIGHDVAHEVHAVRAARPVVPDGAGHAAVDGLVDHRDGQQTALAFADVGVLEHDAVAMEAVHDNVLIGFLVMVAHDGHRVAVLLDAVVEQLKLRRGDGVRIVGVRLHLLDGHGDNAVHGALKRHPTAFLSTTSAYSRLSAFTWRCCSRVSPNPMNRQIWSFFKMQ